MSSSSSSHEEFGHLQIPLEDIVSATNKFSVENLIGESALKRVYKGQLSRSEEEEIDIIADRLREKDGAMFWSEISMLSWFDDENVVSVIGFCDEKDEKIIIYKVKAKGSLDTFLSDPALTWVRRLEICVGIAHALSEVHHLPRSYLDPKSYRVHRNISSSIILLDDKWKPKLSGFELSVVLSVFVNYKDVHGHVFARKGYIDPAFEQIGTVSWASDVYSLGVVLFEVLCGRTAYVPSKQEPLSFTQQLPDDDLLAPLAKSYYEAGKLHDLVHPGLCEEIDPNSFKVFSDIAYECLNDQDPWKRPLTETICKRLEHALDLQRKHENHTKNLQLLEIAFKDIKSATEDFCEKNIIGSGAFGTIYKAILKNYDNRSSMTHNIVAIKCIKDKEGKEGFSTEIEMLSRCRHRNVVSLLGFCDDLSKMILVYEYHSRGSLDWYLERTGEMENFKWVQRLQMCLDIAEGLKYIHTEQKIIHRDIKSANILLADDWVAKIADFGLSKAGPINQEVSYLDTRVAGTKTYLDPEYKKTNELRKASDIYSMGVVLFEIMTGTLAYNARYIKENKKGLAPFVRQQYAQKKPLKDMLDPNLNEEIDENIITPRKGPSQDSLKIFFDIAYECLAEKQIQRPDIGSVVQKLKEAIHTQNNWKSKHQIPFKAINLATDEFSDDNRIGYKRIGRGALGRFYKGKAKNVDGSHTDIFVQRLDIFGRGEAGFLNELEILTKYRHENVIGVLGYCDESDEKIIVYEYVSRGFLVTHLDNPYLTWKQRLQICIDIASGLYFLQGGGEGEEFVIHGDIKCSNILLTEDWKPKLSDFGFSVLTDKKNTKFLLDEGCDTEDENKDRYKHKDPSYKTSGLTKESDIFSFGVLLVDILMVFKIMGEHYRSYVGDGAVESINEQIAPKSYTTIEKLAEDCMEIELQFRPTISKVLLRIKQALELQVDYERWNPKLPNDCEQIIKMSKSPKDYETKKEEDLYDMLVKGIVLQESKVLFTLGDNGERNLMTSARTFSYINRSLCR